MILVHKHLLVRAEVKKPIVKQKSAVLFLEKLIRTINMKSMFGPVARYCDMKGNRGVTAIAIIETSHIAMHVWDEVNPALVQLDVYSCAEMNPKKIIQLLKEELDTINIEYKFLDRDNNFKEISLK
tara:strand:+ start:605 stop:982 length:378 start_codon:yes stop_codon:yes gene_type:complete